MSNSNHQENFSSEKIAVIGLGYVGLPLSLALGEAYETIGFDTNLEKINELKGGVDRNKEMRSADFEAAKYLSFTAEEDDSKLVGCSIYIVTVPTPVDKYHTPDLSFIEEASKHVGKVLSNGNLVIYESTVYPGCTEEVCAPILEKESRLKHNSDFFTGYSPERINPGDKEHTLKNIVKVTSGSNERAADRVDALYRSIIPAGTKRASSIKVAEAAKVIENTQRDINIAFVNELAILFEKLDINTQEVLEVAGSKWNFLNFKPGLVGGHCIGVDPYYLTYKAEALGLHPEIILAGRRINDRMPNYIASHFVKLFLKKKPSLKEARVLVLGITFKENCTDIRNSKVIDLIHELWEYEFEVDVFDPMASVSEVKQHYGIQMVDKKNLLSNSHLYDGVIYCVNHREFVELDYGNLIKTDGIIYAIKSGLSNYDFQL